MKDEAIRLARSHGISQERKNRLRDYLQHLLLRHLFETDLLAVVIFHGGEERSGFFGGGGLTRNA